jgi:hypothetical protein
MYKSSPRISVLKYTLIDDDFETEWNGTWGHFIDIYEGKNLNVAVNLMKLAKELSNINANNHIENFLEIINYLMIQYPKYENELEKYLLLI